MELAIIADVDFETFFDEIKPDMNYKNAQLEGHSCAFLSANNGIAINLDIIRKLGVRRVVEITGQDINSEEIVKNTGVEYTGFSIKGSLKEEYIKPLIKSVMEDNRSRAHANLTLREKEVLKLITEGLQNRQIAKKLYLSEKTVKNHVSNIFKKIEVTNRTNAALYAMKNLK